MNNFLQAITSFLNALFSGRTSPARPQSSAIPTQSGPTDNIAEPIVVSPRVLLIVIDPIVDPASGEKLTQRMKWYRPEDLIATFLDDTVADSAGLARYQIVDRIEVNDFPKKRMALFTPRKRIWMC